MKKALALLLSLLLVIGLMAGCTSGGGTEPAEPADSGEDGGEEAKTYEFVMASFDNASTVACQLGTKFAELAAEKSDGRIKINFHTDSTLASETEQYDLIKSNEIQICYFADSFGSQLGSTYDPAVIPYLFTDIADVEKMYESDLGKTIMQVALEKGNVHFLGTNRRSPRLLTCNKEISDPSMLKGVKLRVPEIQPWVTVWNSMGASCTVVAWAETYSALQTGVVDGQENPIDNIYANKIYEVNKFIMNTEHMNTLNKWFINNDCWEAMDPADQAILQEAFDEAAAWANGALAELTEQYKSEILADGSVKWVEVDKLAFQQAGAAGIEEVKAGMQPETQAYIDSYMGN